MKTIIALAVASLLLTSAVGCSSCRSWFNWNKGSNCDAQPECGYPSGPVMGAPIYTNPGPG